MSNQWIFLNKWTVRLSKYNKKKSILMNKSKDMYACLNHKL